MMFSVTSLAGAFSGLLAAAIEDMDGLRGLSGWAWIFVLVRYSSYCVSSIFGSLLTGERFWLHFRKGSLLSYAEY